MLLWYGASLILVVLLGLGLQFMIKMRALRSAKAAEASASATDRYRPMLRLLSDADLNFLPSGSPLRRTLAAQRRALFRAYLRCLTRDYARLLAGIRLAMVQSGVDRPDLTRALAKNRFLFAVAICRVEYRLALHAAGIGHVEIGGLVDALESLRRQVSVLAPMAQAA
jgi:hypothetical protein